MTAIPSETKYPTRRLPGWLALVALALTADVLLVLTNGHDNLHLLCAVLGLIGLAGLWRAWQQDLAQAGAQAQQLKTMLEDAIEAMPAGFELWDAQDRLVLCNQRLRQHEPAPTAEHAPGSSFESLVQRSVQPGAAPGARGPHAEPLLQQYGERWTHIHEQRTPSGYLVGVRLDVTELVKAQLALSEAQAQAQADRQLLERTVDAMPAGIEIYDAQDRLITANQRMASWQPQQDYALARGKTFEWMLRRTLATGNLPVEAQGREEAWVAERLAARGRHDQAMLHQLPSGLWLKTYETRTPEGFLVAVRQDVSDLVAKELELTASRVQLQAIIRTAGVAIITTDAQGLMLSCNPAAERLFGHPLNQMLGQKVSMLLDAPKRGGSGHFLRRLQQAGDARQGGRPRELSARHKSGAALTLQVSVSEVHGPEGSLYVGVMSDLTERKQFERELQNANEALLRLSTTDALTELANRRLLMQRLDEEWRRALRSGTSLSVLLIDVDNFKLYNDHYGHPAGDACLVAVAQALRGSAARPADLVARYGGEEFVLLLPQTQADGAQAVATRCREALQKAQIAHALSPQGDWVTVSIGMVSAVPMRGGSASQWLAQADLALYQAKAQGRDRAVASSLFGTP